MPLCGSPPWGEDAQAAAGFHKPPSPARLEVLGKLLVEVSAKNGPRLPCDFPDASHEGVGGSAGYLPAQLPQLLGQGVGTQPRQEAVPWPLGPRQTPIATWRG